MMQGFVSLEGDFVWGHVKNMGVEILGSDHTKGQTISIMANDDGDWAQTIGSNNIKQFSAPAAAEDSKPAFPGVPNGSLKVDDGGQETALDNGVPKDVKDEWPAPKEIHTFYYVKFRSYEDLQLKLKTNQANKDLQKKNQARYQIIEALRAKRVSSQFCCCWWCLLFFSLLVRLVYDLSMHFLFRKWQ